MPTPTRRPEELQGEPPALEGGERPSVGRPRLTLDLQAITPVVGGGVRPMEPDSVEAVRVPGIRGQLREWWRRLYGRADEDVESLFRREAALWGGVGAGGQAPSAGDNEDGPGLRSRVVIRLDPEGTQPGVDERPGGNRSTPGAPPYRVPPQQRPRTVGLDFGYALFPLQGSHDVRYDLAFRLVVSYRTGRRHRSADELREPLRQMLASVWAWVHLGGVGARTRRGFGALELAAPAVLEDVPDGLQDLVGEWRALFAGVGRTDLGSQLERFQRAAAASGRWSPLMYAGREESAPEAAHRSLLASLRRFRQGTGFARDSGSKPGQSRWPEGDLLRLRKDPEASWEHPVRASVKEEQNEIGAPRAAFGLPIVMHFKSGRNLGAGQKPDSDACGQILPEGLERWASPILLRPVRWRGKSYRPLVLVLPDRVPGSVQLRFDREHGKKHDGIVVASSAGARDPIRGLLAAKGGHAVEAYVSWLINNHGFGAIRTEADGE